MSGFEGMEDLLQDFLVEAGELLAGVDNKLVDLEQRSGDHSLLNEIFRGFHTIKGGAGFLNATELVTLCHLTENLFDKLRNNQMSLTPEIMDVIMAATAGVRTMFDTLERGMQPGAADPAVIAALKQVLAGKAPAPAPVMPAIATPVVAAVPTGSGPDWNAMFQAVVGKPGAESGSAATPPMPVPPTSHELAGVPADQVVAAAIGRRATDKPGAPAPVGRRDSEKSRDTSIRVDTARLDQVLNLSGEIGLTKNRLNALRSEILNGHTDTDTLHALDQAVSQLDQLVSDMQNAVMKTRMQPVGRLFQKYPRIARDLARSLGKDVELELVGEDTEIDKTMIEDLGDPIIHLIRNAVDHGVESTEERRAAGKSEKSRVRLEARQEGDHIVILINDDGRGMNAEKLRAKALEKGLISGDQANIMDERQSFELIMLPGFSTKDVASDVSGRGVGMDVVKTNIQKLKGNIDILSTPGRGSTFIISLPLTLAILPVLLVQLEQQPFAVPLSMVREIIPIRADAVQEIGGRATMVVRGEVMPIYPLNHLLGWNAKRPPTFGVLMQGIDHSAFILAIDGFMGREDAVVKSLDDFRPKGVSGVTTLSNGKIVLILDMKELFGMSGARRGVPRSAFLPPQDQAA
ncbi:MAG: chemotaxis protein CheA [Rhodocyclales bacterium]|nr:chemotaxis protein CheA [Rhodocyclales bacterium]